MTFKVLATTFGLGVMACVALLAWMPSPDVRDLKILPTELGIWFDTRDFERNVIGGFVLQLAVSALAFAWFRGKGFVRLLGIASVISFVVFALAEGVQVFLPRRSFDWMDIGAALLGISISNLIVLAIALPVLGVRILSKNCTKKDSNLQPID